jgi:hypothetical protein
METLDIQLDEHYFKCAACGGIFKKGRTDDEAMEACEKEFGRALSDEESVLVCDDCWEEMKPVIFN